MGAINDTANTVWRDYETSDPKAGSHKPIKSEIRSLFSLIETQIDGEVAIADLRAVPSVVARTKIIEGYDQIGDGGGGVFVWDAASSHADNGGTIVKPDDIAAPAVGRYKRLHDGALNILHFGCKGDGVIGSTSAGTDNTEAFQRVINAALEDGYSKIVVPPGIFFFPRSSPSLDPGDGGFMVEGHSPDKSLLLFEEGSDFMGTGISDLNAVKYLFRNTINTGTKRLFGLRNLQFRGFRDTYGTQSGGHAMWLDYYSEFYEENVFYNQLARFCHDIHYCRRARSYWCHFKNCARDCVRFRDCLDIDVLYPLVENNGDDAIACHTNSTTIETWSPLMERIRIHGARIINGGEIKVLGGRKIQITDCFVDLCNLNGIEVNVTPADTAEGDNPIFDVTIARNQISDMLTITGASPQAATSYIGLQLQTPGGATATHGIEPGQYDATAAAFVKEQDWYDKNITNSANAVPPGKGIRIVGNTLTSSRRDVAKISDYGYGKRMWQGVEYDPAVNTELLRPQYGVVFFTSCASQGTEISGNTIEHVLTGIGFPPTVNDRTFRSWKIDNMMRDVKNRGIYIPSGTSPFHADIDISGTFDIDPYRVNANSNINGSYAALGLPTAVDVGNNKGIRIRGCRFANCCQMIGATDASMLAIERNMVECGQPVAIGFSTSHKGIGAVAGGNGAYRYKIIDADPTSATYRQVVSVMQENGSVPPAAGWYFQGAIVVNTAAGQGKPWGWIATTNGNPPVWRQLETIVFLGTALTDADQTLTPGTDQLYQSDTVTLTATRKLTLLSTGGATGSTRWKYTRTGAGAFNREVYQPNGSTLIKAMAQNTWGEFVLNATTGLYYLAAYGTL